MIPGLTDDGYLPPGIHPASLDEIESSFGRQTEIRRAEMESLRWLVDEARRRRVQRMIVDGSFVSDRAEPNDVDCVLLFPDDFVADAVAREQLESGFPFLDMSVVDRYDFDIVVTVFSTDRAGVPKGMIEVAL